jgi:hypothetical protein
MREERELEGSGTPSKHSPSRLNEDLNIALLGNANPSSLESEEARILARASIPEENLEGSEGPSFDISKLQNSEQHANDYRSALFSSHQLDEFIAVCKEEHLKKIQFCQ